ncbi:anti-sigma factor domain-containing protein [Fictibacillus gelatini]|nr:anti-sigma factor domain-containing protein [Fictibacillus gelatini]
MKKGIIIEVGKRHLIVLAEGGEFRKLKKKKRSYTVGTSIIIPIQKVVHV